MTPRRRVRVRAPAFAACAAACAIACAAGGAAASTTAGASNASASGNPGSSRFCDISPELSAVEQDKLLRFAAVVREELAASDGGLALVSRSGLDLSRFGIRYSHAALAWRADNGAWAARQLYYACDEGRPRIFDQGLAGFAMGTDDPALGYISLVRVPAGAVAPLRSALLDTPRVLRLLAGRYSANAYAYGLDYQNCNQWLVELLAVAWGGLEDGAGLRGRAQDWLRAEGYAPEPVDVGSRLLMLAPLFMPLLHLDDHPAPDRAGMKLRVSLPSSIEGFIRGRVPGAERVEICHDDKRVVVHRGWTPIASGCVPGDGDRVIPLD
ncbi:DUF2145 domain-containing protein [Pseudoduganella namucuonensis]|uniref:DUF2145 domain-containing protein n=1 Tax=Pseudoduganella namucuonensis TaxID=1035707 RepID=A0A1I7LPV9_9BURK|nr:DUF2145 domain-containing protein [Pseudoduganella namucuonensis]SFV11674.1 hypothetical protein SAMN05216552_103472 [Pseudoduganella namucuonensis]